jgi:cytochrome c oxidase assembly protein subunit 11
MSAQSRRHGVVALACAGFVAVMVGAAYASVPFYNWFCSVTGFGGATVTASQGADRVLDEAITIRFDANTADGMPWSFEPVVRTMRMNIGETGLAFYRAHNPTDRPVAGQAAYNVAPLAAGGYFAKIDCFCFTLQVLQPGETVDMPVSFFVDPAIRDDPDGRGVQAITLSYTFYQTDLPEDAASALATAPEAGQNTTN